MVDYIKTHWRGDNSLAYAYWINGVALQAAFSFLILYLQKNTTYLDNSAATLAAFVLLLLVSTWALVGIWRSAGQSIQRAKVGLPRRSPFWAYAARFMVVLGALRIIADAVPVLHDLNEMRRVEQSDLATSFNLFKRGESDVMVEGFINGPSIEAIKKVFSENQERLVLSLNSPGGLLADAFELADFVEKRGLWVVAEGQCQSACLLVLAAGRNRLVTPEVHLLFHHPEASGSFISQGARELMQEEVEEYYARFRRYGVPAERLDQLRRSRNKTISIGEAYNLYLIDQIWLPWRNEILDIEAACREMNCFTTPVLFPDPDMPVDK